MDYSTILTEPMQREDWPRTVLIGGLLLLFSFLLVPLLVAYGYVVRAIRSAMAEDAPAPAFDDWGGLLVDGVQGWVIGVVYLLVPAVVAGLTVGASVVAMLTGGNAGVAAGIGGLFLGFTLSALLSVVFGYLAVVALVNFAREERFGAAFDVSVIKAVALDREYAIAWLVSAALFVVVGLLTVVPVIGWVLVPFGTFYAALVAARLWADGFSRAMDSTGEGRRRRDEDPAI